MTAIWAAHRVGLVFEKTSSEVTLSMMQSAPAEAECFS